MNEDFSAWRDDIKRIDREVIRLLEQRFELVRKIGLYKKEHDLPVRDEAREKFLVEEMVGKTELSSSFVRDFYETLFANSYLIEQ